MVLRVDVMETTDIAKGPSVGGITKEVGNAIPDVAPRYQGDPRAADKGDFQLKGHSSERS